MESRRSLRSPSISDTLPRSAKSLFSPPYVEMHARTRAHASRASHRRRVHASRQKPLLHALKSRTLPEDTRDHARRRGCSLRVFTGLQFTRIVASVGLPAAAGRHSTTTATPALSSRYHYPHLVVARHRESQSRRARLAARLCVGVKNTRDRRVTVCGATATRRGTTASRSGSSRGRPPFRCTRAAGRPCRPC